MKSAWKNTDKKIIMDFGDEYIRFLNMSKTERLCVNYSKKLAESAGFEKLEDTSALKAGSKVYAINRGKNIALVKIGTEPITNGVNIVAAHIDSPRIDLKPHPVSERDKLAVFETHYYGGIRKYHWVATPLSLIGTVITASGNAVEINIGEGEGDPVFTITDLLPHLAKEQSTKKLSEAFPGEKLDILAGSLPNDDEEKDVKDLILDIFKEKYGIEEDDFISAELELVPAVKACTVGLDLSMIGGYGQDDRVCAFPAVKALFDCGEVARTSICFLVDKEETGSEGNTGTKSRYFENLVAELIEKVNGSCSSMDLRRTLSRSMCISADVTAAYDPLYGEVFEKSNCAYAGEGIAICKYTGAGGKSATSDASAEFMAKIRNIFDSNDVVWQVCELGKVDQGGGGTVAKYLADLDIDTVDIGVPVFSMHSPFEISSKADIYMGYKAYKAFFEAR